VTSCLSQHLLPRWRTPKGVSIAAEDWFVEVNRLVCNTASLIELQYMALHDATTRFKCAIIFRTEYSFLSQQSLKSAPKGRFTHSMPCPCHAHAVPMPCPAANGLDCVYPIWFTQCGHVWFALAMPCPWHAPSMPFYLRPLARSRQTACALPARVRLLPATTRSSTKVVIRSVTISDAGGQCEAKQRLSWTRIGVVAAHYVKDVRHKMRLLALL